MNWLVYGSTGWIAQQFFEYINDNKIDVNIIPAKSRLENFEDIRKEIELIKPDRVVVLGGLTYKPPAKNIDWCEDHKQEVIRANVMGTLNIADICEQLNIHCTILGTGCVYSSLDRNIIYTENSMWDFDKSFYSKTKAYTQELLRNYKNVLLLRIRMCITNTNNPKNFIIKLLNFDKIISIPNSMSVLPELIPVMVKLIEEHETGTWNIVNPNVISHKEILDMCGVEKEYIDISQQSKVTCVARSNNHLSTDKLMNFAKKHGLVVNEIHVAVKNMIDSIPKELNLD